MSESRTHYQPLKGKHARGRLYRTTWFMQWGFHFFACSTLVKSPKEPHALGNFHWCLQFDHCSPSYVESYASWRINRWRIRQLWGIQRAVNGDNVTHAILDKGLQTNDLRGYVKIEYLAVCLNLRRWNLTLAPLLLNWKLSPHCMIRFQSWKNRLFESV